MRRPHDRHDDYPWALLRWDLVLVSAESRVLVDHVDSVHSQSRRYSRIQPGERDDSILLCGQEAERDIEGGVLKHGQVPQHFILANDGRLEHG